jgi:hypothetical protein
MKRFGTDEFRFDLPGEGWRETTVHTFSPKDSDASVFTLSRSERAPELYDDLWSALRNFPKRPDIEIEVLGSGPNKVGPLDGWETGVLARSRRQAEYLRYVRVGYYDLDLHFCWAGPAAERAAIDERAERSMQTMRFRSKW